jgi:hypothetical protein
MALDRDLPKRAKSLRSNCNLLQDLRVFMNARHQPHANGPPYSLRYLPLVNRPQTRLTRRLDSPCRRHVFGHDGEILLRKISLLLSIY